MVASCTPCDWSPTISRSGYFVAARRLRRSTSSPSGTWMRNGLISEAGAAEAGLRVSKLDTPATTAPFAMAPRSSRRSRFAPFKSVCQLILHLQLVCRSPLRVEFVLEDGFLGAQADCLC